jgi:hypothetical protein
MSKDAKLKAINLREKVEVIATANAPYHKKGDKVLVHPNVAEAMIAKGWAAKAK